MRMTHMTPLIRNYLELPYYYKLYFAKFDHVCKKTIYSLCSWIYSE
jgi:hypothetical protein